MNSLNKSNQEFWLTRAQYEARKSAGQLVPGSIYHITDDKFQSEITEQNKLDYSLISNAPTIPTKTSDITNDSGFIDKDVNNLTNYTKTSSLSTVATSGSYADLSSKPVLNTNNASAQTAQTAETLSGTINLHKVSKTGNYNDLLNKPTIPTSVSVSDTAVTSADNIVTSLSSNGMGVRASKLPIAKSLYAVGSTDRTKIPTSGAVSDYIASRGENLLTNGAFLMNSNYNFSGFKAGTGGGFRTDDAYYCGGCVQMTGNVSPHTDEYMAVDPNKTYELSYYIKCSDKDVNQFDYIGMYDIDKLQVGASEIMFVSGTTTYLTQDLNQGDTVIHVNDVSKWQAQSQGYRRGFIAWDYTNSKGFGYMLEGYSRHHYTRAGSWSAATLANENEFINGKVTSNFNNKYWFTRSGSGTTQDPYVYTEASTYTAGTTYYYWNHLAGTDSGLWSATDRSPFNNTANTITLDSPWVGRKIKAGTYISQSSSGGTYKYLNSSYYVKVANEWENKTGIIGTVGKNDAVGKFRDGTAYVSVGYLINYGNRSTTAGDKTTAVTKLSNLSFGLLIPSKTSQLTNDNNFVTKDADNLTNYTKTSSLATVATSGSYNDLSSKPTIPTKTSDITNDSGFITSSDVPKEFYPCTYGTTTYNDITTALNNGLLPICKYNGITFIYLGIVSSKHYFGSNSDRRVYRVSVDTSNTWAYNHDDFEFSYYKTQSLTSASTSSQYPSAKATYDAIQDVRESFEGKAKNYVINSQSDITGTKATDDNYTNVTAITGVTMTELREGDNVLVKDSNSPNYWVSRVYKDTSSITTLAGTTWIINDHLSLPPASQIAVNNINFTVDESGEVSTYFYVYNNIQYLINSTWTYVYNSGWANQKYRTVTFNSGAGCTNATLIDWLKANATLSIGQTVCDLSVLSSTGDYVPSTRTVNGHQLSSDITVTKEDVGLGNVGNFKAVSTVASQGLTDAEKSNARANIGAGTSNFSGNYNDLTNKPTIPEVPTNYVTTDTTQTISGQKTFSATRMYIKGETHFEAGGVPADYAYGSAVGIYGNKMMCNALFVPKFMYRDSSMYNSGVGNTTWNLPNKTSGQTYTLATTTDLDSYTPTASLSAVATSGNYNDLTNKPSVEVTTNKVSSITSSATDTQYPSAKATFEAINDVREVAEGKPNNYVISLDNNPKFNSTEDSIRILASEGIRTISGESISFSTLHLSDNFLITEENVPDRWVSEFEDLSPIPDAEGSTIVVGTPQPTSPASFTDASYITASHIPYYLRRINDTYKDVYNASTSTVTKIVGVRELLESDFNTDTPSGTLSGYTIFRNTSLWGASKFNANITAPFICSHFASNTQQAYQYPNTLTRWGNSAQGMLSISNTILGVSDSDNMTTKYNALKNWIASQRNAGTPVLVYYVMATPQTEVMPLYEEGERVGIVLHKLETAKVPITSISVNGVESEPVDGNVNISVPTKTSNLTNDSGFITKDVSNLTNYTKTSSLATVATSGSYNSLSDKPSIPTKTSDITNDSGFIISTDSSLSTAMPVIADTLHGISNASAGQIVKISSVNSSGVPTGWETSDSVNIYRHEITLGVMAAFGNIEEGTVVISAYSSSGVPFNFDTIPTGKYSVASSRGYSENAQIYFGDNQEAQGYPIYVEIGTDKRIKYGYLHLNDSDKMIHDMSSYSCDIINSATSETLYEFSIIKSDNVSLR